jgi:hypothetical protein
MTFASALPILYPIGLISIIFIYWTDKYLFLRLYKKPPLYDGDLADRALTMIKLGLFIHIILSIYIYSNNEILSASFKSESLTIGEEVHGFFYLFM